MTSWRYNANISTESSNGRENELDDTAASPVKKPDDIIEDRDDRNSSDSGTKRHLEFQATGTVEKDIGAVDLMIADGATLLNIEEGDGMLDKNKRLRKDGAVSPSNGSAGSLEEPVREQ
jgi:hypothetical protein